MRRHLILILLGTAIEALATGLLAWVGWIHLSPIQQIYMSAVALGMNFVWFFVAKRGFSRTLIGMAVGGLVSGLPAWVGWIHLSPIQQIYAGLTCILVIALLLRKEDVRGG